MMRIKSLHLENIGPFVEADLEFMTDADDKPPVVLITGENGTGKSIILDAIRGIFGGQFVHLERDLRRKNGKSIAAVEASLLIDSQPITLIADDIKTQEFLVRQVPSSFPYAVNDVPDRIADGQPCPNWIVDFWPSSTATGSYKVNELRNPDHRAVFQEPLQGRREKSDIAQLMLHFDYLRDSRDAKEKSTGEVLYKILTRIIKYSLLKDGYLSHIARATYEPIIVQNGIPVSLANLSSGNAYMIQSLVGLLGKMYSIQFLRNASLDDLGKTPGLLLIDEAENQLHPKWQKRLFRIILELFPNLQIVAATHSPFIISSVENARLFVCKSQGDRCIVVDETAEYSNKPVDEILMSPLFEETQPFNEQITQLLEDRKRAIEIGDEQTRTRIEEQLKAFNPEYFGYLELDQLLADVTNGKVHA